MDRCSGRMMHKTHRQLYRQTNRQTDGQIEKYVCRDIDRYNVYVETEIERMCVLMINT